MQRIRRGSESKSTLLSILCPIPTPPIPSEGSALMLLACFLHEGNCTGSQMRHHVGNDTRPASCCPVYSAQHLDFLFPAIVE